MSSRIFEEYTGKFMNKDKKSARMINIKSEKSENHDKLGKVFVGTGSWFWRSACPLLTGYTSRKRLYERLQQEQEYMRIVVPFIVLTCPEKL